MMDPSPERGASSRRHLPENESHGSAPETNRPGYSEQPREGDRLAASPRSNMFNQEDFAMYSAKHIRLPRLKRALDIRRETRPTTTQDTNVRLTHSTQIICTNCKTDKQHCFQPGPQQKCERCDQLGYQCSLVQNLNDVNPKRRKLSRVKCQPCRAAKQKCRPENRVWPDKCERCMSKGIACSPPEKPVRAEDLHASPSEDLVSEVASPIAESEGSDDETDNRDEKRIRWVQLRNDLLTRQAVRKRPHVVRERTPPRLTLREAVRKVQISQRLITYKHQPLRPDTDIRLAVIHPGRGEEMIRCHLEEIRFPSQEALSPTRSYAALSYNWGWEVDEPNHEIRILNHVTPQQKITSIVDAVLRISGPSLSASTLSGKPLYIRPNLFNALRQLRSSEKEVALWVDALCIDGENPDEKGRQVAKMPATFSNAEEVYIWLGIASESSHLAMDFIPKLLDLNQFDAYIADESTLEGWYAFGELMNNRWFTRRWVLQEVVLAKNAVLHCGTDAIKWSDFATAVALYNSRIDQVKRLFRFSRKHLLVSNFLGGLIDANAFVYATSNLVRRSSDGAVISLRCSIEVLVTTLFTLEASHPSDTIYSLLPLAKDASNITIDYSQPPIDVLIDFVSSCIRSSKSLDIICRPWAPSKSGHFELPSWILSTSGSPYGASTSGMRHRVNGDSFVGSPGRPVYNAAGGQSAIVEIGSRQMVAKGAKLDRITELGARSIQGIIFKESLEMGGLEDGDDGTTVPDALWRTLVADRGTDGKDPPIWYRQAFLHCLGHITTQGDIMTNDLIEHSPALVTQFLQRVQAVIWNRKFFKTEERALFGLAPSAARYGDIVCVLAGCSVPVVLRERRENRRTVTYAPLRESSLREDDLSRAPRATLSSSSTEYEFVGECYVHDIMDGEVELMTDCVSEFITLT